MNLEKLVPPLELCKQIPEGKFAESALVWKGDLDGDPLLFPRECGICNQYGAEIAIAPAPTLAEILEELDAIFDDCEYDVCVWNSAQLGKWGVQIVVFGRTANHIEYDANPATAALKLWMEVNKETTNDRHF